MLMLGESYSDVILRMVEIEARGKPCRGFPTPTARPHCATSMRSLATCAMLLASEEETRLRASARRARGPSEAPR